MVLEVLYILELVASIGGIPYVGAKILGTIKVNGKE